MGESPGAKYDFEGLGFGLGEMYSGALGEFVGVGLCNISNSWGVISDLPFPFKSVFFF